MSGLGICANWTALIIVVLRAKLEPDGDRRPLDDRSRLLVYNNGKFGVSLVDPFTVSGYFSDGRRTTRAKPAVLVQFLKTLHLDFKSRQFLS